MANDLDKITQNFINEIGDIQLNEEQKRIYNAFVYRKRGMYNFCINDKYGNTIRFSMYTNKTDDGVIHILKRHYNNTLGHVTAMEILCFPEVVRMGNITADKNTITYTMKKSGRDYSLIIGLKTTGTEKNILKSFYSDKK